MQILCVIQFILAILYYFIYLLYVYFMLLYVYVYVCDIYLFIYILFIINLTEAKHKHTRGIELLRYNVHYVFTNT